MAVGSMVAGLASLLVSFVVWCFGVIGAEDGWGALVSGAFCALSVLLGLAAVALGARSLRQIRRTPGTKGGGLGITGIVCGGLGLLLAIGGLVVAIVISGTQPTG
jgi:hypothetical protein